MEINIRQELNEIDKNTYETNFVGMYDAVRLSRSEKSSLTQFIIDKDYNRIEALLTQALLNQEHDEELLRVMKELQSKGVVITSSKEIADMYKANLNPELTFEVKDIDGTYEISIKNNENSEEVVEDDINTLKEDKEVKSEGFYFKGPETSNVEEQLKYLQEHATHVEHPGYRRVYANSIKIYDLGLEGDLKDKAYEILADEVAMDFFWDQVDHYDDIYSSGRMGGWLVLDDKVLDPNDFDFEEDVTITQLISDELDNYYYSVEDENTGDSYYEGDDIAEATEAVKNKIKEAYETLITFDKNCDEIRNTFISFLSTYSEEEEITESLKDLPEDINDVINEISKVKNITNVTKELSTLYDTSEIVLIAYYEIEDTNISAYFKERRSTLREIANVLKKHEYEITDPVEVDEDYFYIVIRKSYVI